MAAAVAAMGGFPVFAPSGADARMPREIFPITVQAQTALNLSFRSLSRSVQRRLHRIKHSRAETRYTASALNACFLGTAPLHEYESFSKLPCKSSSNCKSSFPKSCHECQVSSAAQVQVLDHIDRAVSALGPPPSADFLSPTGALNELCGAVSGYDCAPKSSLPASYEPDRLSLPEGAMQPAGLVGLWDHGQSASSGQQVIDSFPTQHPA